MTPRRPRGLTEPDRILWETVTRSVRPLRTRRPKKRTGQSEPAANAPEPVAPPAPARPIEVAAELAPQRKPPGPPPLAPLEPRVRQRLARGAIEVDARIDLHGLTQHEAHVRLVRFLAGAQSRGARIVLVITGKGTGGAPGPDDARGVLRRQVPHWLRLPEVRPLIVGFETAHAVHGGDGALYVRVRRRRDGPGRS